MNDFKRKIEEFLSGRHGSDQLSFTLSLAGLILVFCSPAFTSQDVRTIFSLLGMGLIIYSIFRVFSKDDAKRTRENQAFVNFFTRGGNNAKAQERKARREQKKRLKEKLKTHVMFYCPKCKASCFVPKGKGKIRITCPKCGEKFIGKT